ncbi:MAG: integrase arm-type DNA-binding domain-containing protein [Alphaproteobacteria bacterium]
MAKKFNRLSTRIDATTTKQGRYADGDGLYLQVSSFDTKAWLFRFTLNGKARQMGLGSVRTVSLAEARDTARECRKQLRDGIDPISHRQAEKAAKRLGAVKAMTFRQCAEAHISTHGAAWRNIKHATQWTSTLESYVYPVIGDLPVQHIDTAMVIRVLDPIWTTKTETATRVRGRIEVILDSAKALGYLSGENPARWRGHLDKLLPKPRKLREVKHHPALPYDEMGSFMASLRESDSTGARGLEFLILTATRTGEVIGARWDEVDFAEKIWTVPADRTKTRKVHRIPLSADALAVLQAMSEVRQSEFIFPGNRSGRPLSNMVFLQLLKRMDRPVTAHGFRSSFRDWVAERTIYPNDVAEMALAHTVSDKVEAAYRRGELLDKRRHMMDDWAAFCSRPPMAKGETVVPLRGA